MKFFRQALSGAALTLAGGAASAHEGHPVAPGVAESGHIHLLDGVVVGSAGPVGLALALAAAAWLCRRSARRAGLPVRDGARRGRHRASR